MMLIEVEHPEKFGFTEQLCPPVQIQATKTALKKEIQEISPCAVGGS
jgi:hypothetical protein